MLRRIFGRGLPILIGALAIVALSYSPATATGDDDCAVSPDQQASGLCCKCNYSGSGTCYKDAVGGSISCTTDWCNIEYPCWGPVE